ncbi:MAG: hypothetical protein ACTSXD_05120 [Candidatus Heimdallarchaeaceae archaeon]
MNKTIILGYKKIQGKNIPVILCEKRKDIPEGMKFYCEFCKRWHLHGKGEGHRAAHCFNSDSPYENTGYILTLNKKYL